MLDIIPIILLTIILVVLLRKPKRINSSIQKIRDQVHSLHQQTSRYEQEIIGIRKEVRNRLGALDTQIAGLETQMAEVKSLLKQYYTSTLFDYQAQWWKDYSWLYRHVQGWKCEECQVCLNLDRQYLHTHHLSGTQHNDPNHLRALCIECHSEKPGENHQKLKEEEDYRQFMEKYRTSEKLK